MEKIIEYLKKNMICENHKTLICSNEFGILFLKTMFRLREGKEPKFIGKALYIPIIRNEQLENDLTCEDIVCVDEDFTTNERVMSIIQSYCDLRFIKI